MIKIFRRLIGRALPTSLEGKAATTTAALLLLTIFVAALGRILDTWDFPGILPGHIAAITVLLFTLPIIVYVGVRYWNRVEESLYPEIDQSWRAGMEALQKVGLSIDSAPLFLMMGDASLEEVFAESMQAGDIPFRLAHVPDIADPALRWYANERAIYLFCRRVGMLSSRVRNASSAPGPRRFAETYPAGESGHAGQQLARRAYISTLTPESVAAAAVAEAPAWQPSTQPRAAPLSAEACENQLRELRYLGRLIRRARRPRCGINGAVIALPLQLESAGERELQHLIDSIRNDAQSILESLWLRFPVTGLVVGMEQVKGFDEFVQSLGAEQMQRRLGARFDVRRRATAERLHKLSDGICDAFERFVYTHFRRHEALWQPENNRKLYALLCRVRERLKPKLNIVLRKAFGEADPRTAAGGAGFGFGERPQIFFSGCYLAATGPRPDQQAFITGVLADKLVKEQARVEWTAEAQRVHLFFKIAVCVGWAVLTILLTVLLLLCLGVIAIPSMS